MSADVVVGVDDLETAGAALRWAARQARQRGVRLRLVHAVTYPFTPETAAGWYVREVVEELDAAGRELLREAAHAARAVAPGLEVAAQLTHAGAREALRAAGADAALLVTGARRRSDLRAWGVPGPVLGSTSLFLAAHAPCPAAVVRAEPDPAARGVLVGWDGSPAAAAALELAAAEAERTGEVLRVVHAWRPPAEHFLLLGQDAVREVRRAGLRRARERAEEAVAAVRERHAVTVQVDVPHDRFASDALVEAAPRVRLLVVGARARGAVLTAVLGSTSHAVLHRVPTPVVVVPALPVDDGVRGEVRDEVGGEVRDGVGAASAPA